jgi:hypothetical protein
LRATEVAAQSQQDFFSVEEKKKKIDIEKTPSIRGINMSSREKT